MDNYISKAIETGKDFEKALINIDKYNTNIIGIGKYIGDETNGTDITTVNEIWEESSPSIYILENVSGFNFPDYPPIVKSMILEKYEMKLNGDTQFHKYSIYKLPNGDIYAAKGKGKSLTCLNYYIDNKTETIPIVRGKPINDELKEKFKNYPQFITVNSDGIVSYYDKATDSILDIHFTDEMLKTIYDPNNKNMPIEDYINDKLSDIMADYNTFIRHKNNELLNKHITAQERAKFDNLLTREKYDELIPSHKASITEHIDSSIDTATHFTTSTSAVNKAHEKFETHLSSHLTDDKANAFDNKANKDHTHSASDIKIYSSNIVNGTIGAKNLPKEVYDKASEINNLSDLANASSVDIMDKYHAGCTIYAKNTKEWYKVIDSSKMGTPDYMQGLRIIETKEITSCSFSAITNKPTNLSGYELSDEVYDRNKIDDLLVKDDLTNRINNMKLNVNPSDETDGTTIVRKNYFYYGIKGTISLEDINKLRKYYIIIDIHPNNEHIFMYAMIPIKNQTRYMLEKIEIAPLHVAQRPYLVDFYNPLGDGDEKGNESLLIEFKNLCNDSKHKAISNSFDSDFNESSRIKKFGENFHNYIQFINKFTNSQGYELGNGTETTASNVLDRYFLFIHSKSRLEIEYLHRSNSQDKRVFTDTILDLKKEHDNYEYLKSIIDINNSFEN